MNANWCPKCGRSGPGIYWFHRIPLMCPAGLGGGSGGWDIKTLFSRKR